MTRIEKIIKKMKNSPQNVRFEELSAVCEHYFGRHRHESTSHRVFRTPWPGDPRVNIQNSRGMAKPYQIGQVLKAIAKLEGGPK